MWAVRSKTTARPLEAAAAVQFVQFVQSVQFVQFLQFLQIFRAHPIKGVGGEVEGHSKASGLDLRQPRGAQAVGLVWRGESGDINQRASNEGHSRQAVVLSIAEAQPTLHEQSE